MSGNLIQNPNFEGGSTANWLLESGWAVGVPSLPTAGVGYAAYYTGPGTAAISNLTQIPVGPGSVITANCWAVGEVAASGKAVLRIAFYRKDGTVIYPTIDSTPVVNDAVWVTRTVSSGVPTDSQAVYAEVQFAVYSSTSSTGKWFCSNFWGSSVADDILSPGLRYYLNLFTSQYKLSVNLNAWQTVLMQPIRDACTCIQQFNAAYDIDIAVGAQLDVLGEIIGVNRTLPFQPTSGSPILDDVTYRLLLRATQANNTWDGHIESLYKIWEELFPNGVIYIRDNQDMTANITTTGAFTSIEQDLINNGFIVPRPEGVLYNYGGAPIGVPLFGFDLNTTAIAGFDTGVWA